MSGRRAILISGRRLEDLLAVFPRIALFDYVVAENGAVVYEPRAREQTLLGKPLPSEFIRRLRELTHNSIDVGQVIVATSQAHQHAVLQAIQEMALELQLIFNREALMVLPVFSQIAEGIEEETWNYHLHRGDYSRWFRDAVKDPYLADHAERIEQRQDLQPDETRKLMLSFIEGRYTLPE